MLLICFCPHCRKYAHCKIMGVLPREEFGREIYYLSCENCGSLFKGGGSEQ